MAKSKYGKNTLGIRAGVQIAKAVEYSDSADYKSFVTDAADGELGIFEDTTAQLLVPGNALLTSTKKVFIALKRVAAENSIDRSQVFRPTDFTISYSAYAAAVKQVDTLLLAEGATGSAVVQDITYTAKAGGVDGNDITITYVVAGTGTALSVAVVGTAITVNLATSGGGAATSTATLIKAAVDASSPAAALVSAAITGTAATVQAAQATTNLQGGATDVPMAKGARAAITIYDMDHHAQPFPTYQYETTARAGESFDAVVARLVTMINDANGVINSQRDRMVSAVYTAGTNTLVLTGIEFGSIFKVILPPDTIFSASATITHTTKASVGSGTPYQVARYALQDVVSDGITTQYPAQGQTPADWSDNTSFVSTTETYDIFNFSGYNSETSKTPHHIQHMKADFAVVVPLSGSNPDAELKTIFGF